MELKTYTAGNDRFFHSMPSSFIFVFVLVLFLFILAFIVGRLCSCFCFGFVLVFVVCDDHGIELGLCPGLDLGLGLDTRL